MTSFLINETISALKFIGKIKKGDKINSNFMIIQNKSLLSRLSRTFFYNDTRTNSLKWIYRNITSAFQILCCNITSDNIKDINLSNQIIHDLNMSKIGIENLIDTYKYDIKFVCDLQTIIQYIDNSLQDVSDSTKL